MKIGIYDRYAYTMGGGEKYMGVMAEYLSGNHEVDIITCENVDKDLFAKRLNLDLSRVTIKIPDANEHQIPDISAQYDMFINATYRSRAFNKAGIGVYIIFFPDIVYPDLPLSQARIGNLILRRFFEPWSTINKIIQKVFAPAANFKFIKQFINNAQVFYKKYKYCAEENLYLRSYKYKFSISEYTQYWTRKMLNMDTPILYPPVDKFEADVKKNIILSVGRFFVESHNKKQLEMIKFFKEMQDKFPESKSYEYHLCGGVDQSEINQNYLKECKKEAEGYPIFIHENIPFDELKVLYSEAKIFWHAAGFGEDANIAPDRFEHFGITTVEAMSTGIVPIVINRGGQPEIVSEGFNGYLWLNSEELLDKTMKVIKNQDITELSHNAISTSYKFSRQAMYDRMQELLKLEVRGKK